MSDNAQERSADALERIADAAEEPQVSTTVGNVKAHLISERVRHFSGMNHDATALAYAEDVSYLLEILHMNHLVDPPSAANTEALDQADLELDPASNALPPSDEK